MSTVSCLFSSSGKARLGVLGTFAAVLAACGVLSLSASAQAAPRVLQVGTYQGKHGQFSSIQAAVNAAHPGDWILIAPGDYHEQGSDNAGVLITTPRLHVRGLDRNGVIVDGTKPESSPCSAKLSAQDFGPAQSGRNGIEVFKTDGVTIENLTVCNFLSDALGDNGNQIWWNGGDGSGVIGLGRFSGAYLTASSTFYKAGVPNEAQYGIFASNSRGPGLIEHSYASNMGDSAFYVGACADCNTVLRFVHAQNSAQGYSGTNAGGHLVLEFSEWDHNQSGIVPSSLANDDPPSPQDGACPHNPEESCTLIQFNYVHDNNNPNTPAQGIAATTLVGSGIDLTGGRNNTVQYNLVEHNGSWGVVLNDYADYSDATVVAYCQGGDLFYTPPSPYDQLYAPLLPIPCYFSSFGNVVKHNVFANNGFFGNDTNGDLANGALPYPTNNCFQGNTDVSGKVTSSPTDLQNPSVAGSCGKAWNPDTDQEFLLTEQLGCASVGLCQGLTGPGYPVQTKVKLLPIAKEPGMPDACAGVPANSWCSK
jgi:hypothetical protein